MSGAVDRARTALRTLARTGCLAVAALTACSTLFPQPGGPVAAADAQVVSDGALADVSDSGGAGADIAGSCNPAKCPQATQPCRSVACVAGACGFTVAGDGSLCDDDDVCTAADRCVEGACQGGGARDWLSLLGKGNGGRLSDVVAGGGGSVWAVGSSAAVQGGYDAWLVKLDRDGRLELERDLGTAESDDLVALIRRPDGGMAAAGYSLGRGRYVRLDAAGNLLHSASGSATNGRFDDIANAGGARCVAVGMNNLNSTTGAGVADAFEPDGALGWTFSRSVPGKRVAITQVAATGPKSATSGGVGLLGYDRTLPPGGSGADLYEMWLALVDASGKQVAFTSLIGKITGAASGLVARDDGSFVAMLDHGVDIQLIEIDANGLANNLTTLPGGSIDTASDLVQGAGGDLFVLRDGYTGAGLLTHLDATGKVLATRALAMPPKLRARIFGATSVGGSAVALVGDAMLQVTGASSTTFRAFARRVDAVIVTACEPAPGCLGGHACEAAEACQVPYCEAVQGCLVQPLAPSVCKP